MGLKCRLHPRPLVTLMDTYLQHQNLSYSSLLHLVHLIRIQVWPFFRATHFPKFSLIYLNLLISIIFRISLLSILFCIYSIFISLLWSILDSNFTTFPYPSSPMPQPLPINITPLACHPHWLFTTLITNSHIIHPVFLHSYYTWTAHTSRWRNNNHSKFQTLLIWGHVTTSKKN